MRHGTRRGPSRRALRACETAAEALCEVALPCRWCGSSCGLLTLWETPGEALEAHCAHCGSLVWARVDS